MEIDRQKIKFAVSLVLWSGLLAYWFQPLIHDNQSAVDVIVTVFSILAGFLVAVITLVGDPKSLPIGSWRIARIGSELTYNRLTRYKWLFKVYLITLLLIFVSIILREHCPQAVVVIEYAYMFFATAACVLSFQLPSALMQLQQERIECEIDARRKAEGIDDGSLAESDSPE